MMLKLVVCVCALAVCYAQDYLTCSCSKSADNQQINLLRGEFELSL